MLKFIFKSFSSLELTAEGIPAICAATLLGLVALGLMFLSLYGVPPIL